MVDHDVMVGALPAARLADALRLRMRAEVHVCEVHPDKDRFAGLVLPLDKVHRPAGDIVVDCFHPFLGERPGVLQTCFPTLPKRGSTADRHVRSLAIQHPRGPNFCETPDLWDSREAPVLLQRSGGRDCRRIRQSRDRRRILVAVAQVVLAKLAGRVAQRLEQLGDRRIFLFRPMRSAWQANLASSPCGIRDWPVMNDDAAGGAALFGVVIGEDHAFSGDTVDVRRAKAHQPHRIGADVASDRCHHPR